MGREDRRRPDVLRIAGLREIGRDHPGDSVEAVALRELPHRLRIGTARVHRGNDQRLQQESGPTFVAGTLRHHRREIAPRAAARNREAIRRCAPIPGVLGDEQESRPGILDRRRERMFGRKAVTDRSNHDTRPRRQSTAGPVPEREIVPHPEPTAVNPRDDTRWCPAPRDVDAQRLGTSRPGVVEVADLDALHRIAHEASDVGVRFHAGRGRELDRPQPHQVRQDRGAEIHAAVGRVRPAPEDERRHEEEHENPDCDFLQHCATLTRADALHGSELTRPRPCRLIPIAIDLVLRKRDSVRSARPWPGTDRPRMPATVRTAHDCPLIERRLP